jgi:hypothetical protein
MTTTTTVRLHGKNFMLLNHDEDLLEMLIVEWRTESLLVQSKIGNRDVSAKGYVKTILNKSMPIERGRTSTVLTR